MGYVYWCRQMSQGSVGPSSNLIIMCNGQQSGHVTTRVPTTLTVFFLRNEGTPAEMMVVRQAPRRRPPHMQLDFMSSVSLVNRIITYSSI